MMEPSRAMAVEAHLRTCRSCARYARVVDQGVGEYRAYTTIDPSDDFLPRLEERLHLVDVEARIYGRTESSATSAGVVVLLVMLIATAAWIPILRSRVEVLRLPPIAAHAPETGARYSFFRAPTLVVPTAAAYSPEGAVIFRHASLNMAAPRAVNVSGSR